MQGQVGAGLGMGPCGLLAHPGGRPGGVLSLPPSLQLSPLGPQQQGGRDMGPPRPQRLFSPRGALWSPRNEGRMPLSSTLPS